ncbi:MAG: HAMP domain-containing histidine kinase [Chloroflexi bacterium]|nr:HAMP domain-containing histidine kinase [Chloroflexota bacterium]
MPPRSIALRMLLASLAVAVVAIGTVAYAAGQFTNQGFQAYVQTGTTQYANRVAQSLADYYASNGSWQGVDNLLPALARPFDERLVVADTKGTVVADSAQTGVGRPASQLGLGDATPVLVDGKEVGQYYLPSGSGGRGPGMMGGAGRMGQTGPRATTTSVSGQAAGPTPEDLFQTTVTRGLWLGAGAAALLAVTLSLLLTRQIVRPLNALAAGARRLASGDLGHRVPISSTEEVGAVATAFNAMAASLEQDEQARRALLADIAHELRTPLTIIEGTADGILDGVLEPNPEQVGIIKEEADLLAKLVADLRDLSLAEAGQIKLERSPQDLGELVGKAVRGFEPTAQQKGVALSFASQPGLRPANVDATRLVQALGNLIGNALRHTPAGGSVSVRVGPDPVASGRYLISVADTGEGIAPADLEHIFERFYRADKSRSRRSGGTGLGLAIARQMVEAHGGRVWAESVPGKGSTFYIGLPVG